MSETKPDPSRPQAAPPGAGPETDGPLRDHLATDRTVLANERTMLAYVRTALTFFIAAATFIRFFDSPVYEAIGIAFMPISVITLALGIVSYRRMKRNIRRSVCDDP